MRARYWPQHGNQHTEHRPGCQRVAEEGDSKVANWSKETIAPEQLQSDFDAVSQNQRQGVQERHAEEKPDENATEAAGNGA